MGQTITTTDGTLRAEFQGPRFGWNARPDRDGQWVSVYPCTCLTCRQMGAHLTEPHHSITFPDGVTVGHQPSRYLVGVK